MTKAIQQSVKFKASPAELFEMYLDSKKHSAGTGGLAKISRKVGGKFKAWGNQLSGRNLLIIPNTMIVQAWRKSLETIRPRFNPGPPLQQSARRRRG